MKHNSSDRIFRLIMKLKDQRIYKWIYRHPHISTMILALVAIIILYIFISFVFNYVV